MSPKQRHSHKQAEEPLGHPEEMSQSVRKLLAEQEMENNESFRASFTAWLQEKDKYKQEIEQLKKQIETVESHNNNMRQTHKVVKQDMKSTSKQIAALQEENAALKDNSTLVHQQNDELRLEVVRVMMVLLAAQARQNQYVSALAKIFAEEKEAKEGEGITETERAVIDHCLRRLTDEERAKFLCECGSLDGGFVFRNQVRRDMDAIMRDPQRSAEIMGETDKKDHSADAVEGPSQEVQSREKRKPKKNRKHRG